VAVVTETRAPGEFEIIARYFAPLAAQQPAALGLGDDAAILDLEPGWSLVATADALVAGVHFLPEDPPGLIARKMLRVNLSDLAAMGARPVGYLMTIALPPSADEPWIAAFAAGLALDQAEFGIGLLGGDTVATPGPLTLSVTALGRVRAGTALRRNAARPGDAVFVSGTLGDAALGLEVLRGRLAGLSGANRDFLVDRYHLPRPRLALGAAVVESGLARAGMDVSDGLVADLGHIAETSGCAAEIEAARLPLSPAASAALAADPGLLIHILAGGDDYELLLAAPPEAEASLSALADAGLTRIGRILPGSGVRVLDAGGRPIPLSRSGYQHR
jgi:thiamine-monophosphate kinase